MFAGMGESSRISERKAGSEGGMDEVGIYFNFVGGFPGTGMELYEVLMMLELSLS